MGGERHPVRGFTSQYILLRSWCLDALLISLFAGAKWRESNESEKATRKGEMILVIAKDCEWVITNHMWCAPSTYAWYMWWIYLHFAQFWLVKWITYNMSKFLIAYGYSSPKHLFFPHTPKKKREKKKHNSLPTEGSTPPKSLLQPGEVGEGFLVAENGESCVATFPAKHPANWWLEGWIFRFSYGNWSIFRGETVSFGEGIL